jgi:glycosyltransferase involved in cell wall biosynthesis
MPVRNAAAHLEAAVRSALAQDYAGAFDVVLGVGPSDDDTVALARRLAASDDRIAVVDNPSGRTAAALNVAIAASAGEIVARVDAHCEIPPHYLTRAVETLRRTGADVVGGIQDARGDTPFARAVAAAMTSRFGVGDSRFHYGGASGPADTVYLGVFRRDALARVSGFDETLVRNQDYELNWRVRDTGGTVWFDPELRVRYRPRSSVTGLARQYFEYGTWKREMLRRHPRSLRWRHLAAPVAVAANAAGLVLGVTRSRRFLAIPALYAAAAVTASAASRDADPVSRLSRLPVAFATMHHAWGAGFLLGRVSKVPGGGFGTGATAGAAPPARRDRA